MGSLRKEISRMSKQSWKGSTLLNPEPPVLVSCGGLDKPNLITIGWTGTICTQPSMVSISVRPERYSHQLLCESGQFAINLPTEKLVRAIDWCGVKSGREVDKFAACGLHAAPGSVLTDCPVLEESPHHPAHPAGQPRPVFGRGGGLRCGREPAGRKRQAVLGQGKPHRVQPRRVSGPWQKAGHLWLQRAEEKARKTQETVKATPQKQVQQG